MIPTPLLSSLRAFPDEDGPRERLAERYENRGDPRSRFIRLQLERARQGAHLEGDNPSSSSMASLSEDERAMLQEYEKSWLRDDGLFPHEVEWRRGLPEIVTISWERLLEAGEQFLENTPVLLLKMVGKKPALKQLFRLPMLQSLPALDLSRNRIDGEEIGALSTTESLSNLHTLSLSRNSLGPTGALVLAACEHLGRLQTLDLSNTSLGSSGAEALATSSHLSGLTALNLSNNALGYRGCTAIAESAAFKNLQRLDLSGNSLYDNDAITLLESSTLRRLRYLSVSQNYFRSDTVHLLRGRFGDRLTCEPIVHRRRIGR